MSYFNQNTHTLVTKITEAYNQLQEVLKCGKRLSLFKKKQIQKRYKRCLQRLIILTKPAITTGTALGVTALFAMQTNAQQCNVYKIATASNPLLRDSLKFSLSKPTFVDIDNDGDLDCYAEYRKGTSNLIQVALLKNNGTKESPYFEQDATTGFSDLALTVDRGYEDLADGIEFADIDGDGDYDCLIGTYHYGNGRIAYFENTGTKSNPNFVLSTSSPFGFRGSYSLHFNVVDIDNDGDYDLVTKDLYYEESYKNIGTPTNPVYKLASKRFNFLSDHYVFYDWDKDGLQDYFENKSFHKNVGTLSEPRFHADSTGPKLPKGFYTWYIADLNNDGIVEFVGEYLEMATTAPDASVVTTIINGNTQLNAKPANQNYNYQWQRNGADVSSANSTTYKPTQPGLYTVQIKSNCGTGISLPYKYRTPPTTLLTSNEIMMTKPAPALVSVQAYPNPFTQSFVVTMGSAFKLNTSINITDMQGRVLQNIAAKSSNETINAPLAKGLYLLQVIQGRTIIYQQKILKQ